MDVAHPMDWSALTARHVPPALIGRDAPTDDRVGAVRRLVAALHAGEGPPAGLTDRLRALLAWSRLDVPLAVLAAGHARAAELLSPSASSVRPAALWAVWLPDSDPPALTARPAGPVYRLDGVVSRPVGGGIVSHAVVVGEVGDEGRLLFAVDLGHPRVHVMSDVRPAAGCPVEFSGAYRFEGVPATPLSTVPAERPDLVRASRLATTAVVLGATAGLADATGGLHGDGWVAQPRTVDHVAARLLAVTTTLDDARTAGRLPFLDAETVALLADARATAADALDTAAAVFPGADGHAESIRRRAGQVELALRLAARA